MPKDQHMLKQTYKAKYQLNDDIEVDVQTNYQEKYIYFYLINKKTGEIIGKNMPFNVLAKRVFESEIKTMSKNRNENDPFSKVVVKTKKEG